MTAGQTLLVFLLGGPATCALLILVVPARVAGRLSIAAASAMFVVSIALTADRNTAGSGTIDPWHEINLPWIASLESRLHLGVDGLSWPLIVLTSLLVLCCTIWLASVERVHNVRALLALIFALQFGMVGVFLALDTIVFFVFFELTLVPMYGVIAGWGGAKRAAAARKFVLYTLAGSVLLLTGVMWLLVEAGTSDMPLLAERAGDVARSAQLGIFAFLAVAFAVKSPLWPLHSWLPDAHTEAPTVGSVLLAGVLLKLGTYGLVRVGVTLAPQGAKHFAPVLAALGVVAIVVAAFVCLASDELKRLIAYSSVGHMGFVLLGIATLNEAGMQAAQVGNVSHGLITGLLFFCVGAVKSRLGSGQLASLGGLRMSAPRLAAVLGFAAIASFGLPGLAGFWGEAFAIYGAAQHGTVWWWAAAIVAAIGAALVVAYFLRMLRLVVTRQPTAGAVGMADVITDLRWGEVLVVAPLMTAILLIGLWPGVVLDATAGPVKQIVEGVAR